ncbi:MAG TPA: energy transducer TonB [Gemmatimonadota bacterium]|nr:energy transducer TonB [Gemmatimonadota bacterium]
MRRWLLTSAALHAGLVLVALLLGLRGPSRPDLPPVYQVNLVRAADLAPQPTRPEPDPEPPPEEEEPPEPEEEEKIPDPDEEPPREEPEPAREEAPRPGPERETRAGPDLPVTLEGRPFEFPWYLEALVRKVERNWRPGGGALKTTIYFRITRGGRITETRVESSSGSFLFDQAAQRAVQASDPMPPLPEEYSGDYLGVYFDFDASVRPSG